MKHRALLIALLLTLGACTDDAAGPTTTVAPQDSSATTAASSSATTTPTGTQAPSTTSSSTAPERQITGAMRSHEGYWTSVDTACWSIRLDGFTVLAGSSPADLQIEGTWEIVDGVIVFQGLDIDGADCGDIEGLYRPELDAEYLILTLIDDECEERAYWMRGAYRMDRP